MRVLAVIIRADLNHIAQRPPMISKKITISIAPWGGTGP